MSCFCCLRCSLWKGAGFNSGHVQLQNLPAVKLDTNQMGTDVVVVKSGRRICGTGGALANAPLVQDKSYFEMKLQSSGVWGIGVATRRCNLHTVPLGTDLESWVLRHDGILVHDNQEVGKVMDIAQEGDIIGVTYNHIELNFYLNGTCLNSPFTGIKGTIYPLFYVDDGATMDIQFNGFYHPAPSGFEEIMIEKSLL